MRLLSRLLAGLTLLLLPVLLPALASAQNFPAKPIELIAPFPAGGPNDVIARVIGRRMSEITKQPVLIDNRGGQK
jgi:tripartite-type tricarboxylate transporter receptor subunit TctC